MLVGDVALPTAAEMSSRSVVFGWLRRAAYDNIINISARILRFGIVIYLLF